MVDFAAVVVDADGIVVVVSAYDIAVPDVVDEDQLVLVVLLRSR